MPLNEEVKESKGPNFDILNPSFTINNKQKISVKAERGNFISARDAYQTKFHDKNDQQNEKNVHGRWILLSKSYWGNDTFRIRN